jgi:hypothetical protein
VCCISTSLQAPLPCLKHERRGFFIKFVLVLIYTRINKRYLTGEHRLL